VILSDPQIMDLGDLLVGLLKPCNMTGRHCEGTHDFTRQWCRLVGLDTEEVLAYLKSRGGYCDCEVITNVYLPLIQKLRGKESSNE